MRAKVRLAAFCVLAAYIALGPFFPQVLGVGKYVFRRWTMYSTFGSDICDVRYERVRPDGTREVLDRRALLGQERARVQWIRDADAVRRVGQKLCRKLGRGADVRVRARCGAPEGWVPVLEGDADLCARPR